MATEVKRRRGTTVEHSTFTGAVAELTVDLTKDTVVVHDGATQGGFPLLREDLSNVPTTAPFTHITLDTAIFDTAYTETESETQGTLYWNQDEETLSLVTNGETIELGQKLEVHVKNQTGSQINKGEVVYASGTVGASGRILVTKMIADGTIAAKRVLGVAAENIANGSDGKVIKFGKLRQINTSTFSNGDILWVSTTVAGGFQNTEPSQANGEISLPIAYVVYSSASVGEIFIRVTPIDENEYQDYDDGLQDISGLTPTDSNFIVGDGTNWVAESGATALASLGAQAQDPQLDDIAGLTPTDGNFIVGNGTNFVAESGNTARTSLGLGTGDSPTFTDVTLTGTLNTNEINTQSDLVWDDTNNTEVWNTSDYYINGALNIAANVYVTDQLDVGESVSVGTTLDVSGNTTLGGTLDVTGNSTIGGSLTLSGSADFNSTMNLQGDLTTQSNLQDDGYATGWSGTNWQIQADGSAELQELRVRGALRVFEFIAKQISTIGGSEILSIAQGRVVSTSASTITLENVTGTPGNSFKANDLWICQVTDINNDLESGGTGSIVKSVRGTVTLVSGNAIIVSVESGSLDDLSQGDLIVAYGNTVDADRQAIMYRNVDRSEDNLIMRLQTEVNAFSDLQAVGNTRVAFGDLNGYSGLAEEIFGFFAGDVQNEHILIHAGNNDDIDGGLFLKDGSTTLAQLTSNTFKVGDDTNYIQFDGSDLDIQTDTFDLTATKIAIDSAGDGKIALGASADSITIDGTEVGFIADGNGEFKAYLDANNYIRLADSSLDIKAEAFDLEAGDLSIDSAERQIQIADSTTRKVTINDNTSFSTIQTLGTGTGTVSIIDLDSADNTVEDTSPVVNVSTYKGDRIDYEVTIDYTQSAAGTNNTLVAVNVELVTEGGIDTYLEETTLFHRFTSGGNDSVTLSGSFKTQTNDLNPASGYGYRLRFYADEGGTREGDVDFDYSITIYNQETQINKGGFISQSSPTNFISDEKISGNFELDLPIVTGLTFDDLFPYRGRVVKYQEVSDVTGTNAITGGSVTIKPYQIIQLDFTEV